MISSQAMSKRLNSTMRKNDRRLPDGSFLNDEMKVLE